MFYKLSEKIIINEVENQGVIMLAAEPEEKLFFLNDTCIDILKYIETTPKCLSEIVEYISEIYFVEKEQCEIDIVSVLNDLQRYNIIYKL